MIPSLVSVITPSRRRRRQAFDAACIAVALLALALPASVAWASPGLAASGEQALERPRSHQAVLRQSARERTVVVVLFSLPGCAFCQAVRAEQLIHLAREQAGRGVRVVEYELGDHSAFSVTEPGVADRLAAPASRRNMPLPQVSSRAASPAALAAALRVRVAPTVLFLGADGEELAERLVGYSSPDFYGAYLDQRIMQARQRLGSPD